MLTSYSSIVVMPVTPLLALCIRAILHKFICTEIFLVVGYNIQQITSYLKSVKKKVGYRTV